MSYAGARLVTDTHTHTDRVMTVTLVRMHRALMNALKCKTLCVELSMHTHRIVLLYAQFMLTTVYLILTLVGNGRQLNLPRGNVCLFVCVCLSVTALAPAYKVCATNCTYQQSLR